MSKKTKYWLCQITGWTLFVTSGIVIYLVFAHGLGRYALWDLIWQALTGFLISLWMRRTIVRHKIIQKTNLTQLIHLIVLVSVFSLIWAICYLLPGPFGLMVGGRWKLTRYFLLAAGRFFVFFPTYCTWVLIYFTYHYIDRLKKQQLALSEQEQEKNLLTIENLKSEKRTAELRQKVTDLEMAALRAQMNPHFIFNCLSSINHFVLKNETEIASDYLTKFSRLIRMVLNNSQRKLISLEEDIEMLQLYIELEKLRFKNSFDCRISYSDSMDASGIFIAPLLLQPFVENAIWHGLMNKTDQGKIEIVFSTEAGVLNCCIIDNGIGRTKAEALKLKTKEQQKSMGLQITRQRLALLNEDLKDQVFYAVDDLVNEYGIRSYF